MREILKAFVSQNLRRFFWLGILAVIIIILFANDEKQKGIEWCMVLAGVALTQVRSNTADPALTPTPKGDPPDET